MWVLDQHLLDLVVHDVVHATHRQVVGQREFIGAHVDPVGVEASQGQRQQWQRVGALTGVCEQPLDEVGREADVLVSLLAALRRASDHFLEL